MSTIPKHQRLKSWKVLALSVAGVAIAVIAAFWISDLYGDAADATERYETAVRSCHDPRSMEDYQARIATRIADLDRHDSDRSARVRENFAYLELAAAVNTCGSAVNEYANAIWNRAPSWVRAWHRTERFVSECHIMMADRDAQAFARYANPPLMMAEGEMPLEPFDALETETLAWLRNQPRVTWFRMNLCP